MMLPAADCVTLSSIALERCEDRSVAKKPPLRVKRKLRPLSRAELTEQRNVNILFFENVSATRSKRFHCPVRFSCYRIHILTCTRKIPMLIVESVRWSCFLNGAGRGAHGKSSFPENGNG